MGHGVSDRGLLTQEAKVDAISNYPVPRNRKELERFLGMVGWYSKFIPDYATVCEPLNLLRRKGVKWKWNSACNCAFQKLKENLISAPCLAFPDMNKDFELRTDASGVGVGCALHQFQNGELRTTGYSSRTLSTAERNYSATEREILAVVWGLEKWRNTIEGRHTVVITDHRALTWIFSTKQNLAPRLYRWVLRVQDFDFEVKFRPGKYQVVPDALSRDSRFEPVMEVGIVDKTVIDDNESEEKCNSSHCNLPQDDIVDWIQCEQCYKWYHDVCVGVDPAEADKLNFKCNLCTVKKPRQVKRGISLESHSQYVLKDDIGEKLVTEAKTHSGKFEQLVQRQKGDPVLGPIVKYLQNPNEKVSPQVQSVAKKYVWHSCLVRDNRICVPKVLTGDILHELHSSPTAGHLGRWKTLKRVLKDFYWPGVGKDVRNCVRTCKTCQLIIPVYRKPPGYMQIISSEGPWDRTLT